MSETKEAGRYSLDRFAIVSSFSDIDIDVSAEIKSWNVMESMDKAYIHGSVTVIDSNNIIKSISGKEELEIVYSDYFDEIKKERYFIYSVTDVRPVNEKDDQIIEFTLHFCSREKFISDSYRVQKAYNGTISKIVNDLYEDFYKQPQLSWGSFKDVPAKTLIVSEATEGEHNFVIPNMRPDEAMDFLAKRAFSRENSSMLFRFWETRDHFYFGTFEDMIDIANDDTDTIPLFRYNMIKDTTPEAQRRLMSDLLSIDFGNKVDTMQDMKYGAYKMRVTELDILNKTPIVYEYNHLEEVDDVFTPTKTKLNHDQKFVDSYLSETQNFLTIKDYFSEGADGAILNPSVRENMHYPEIFTTKSATKYHGKQNMITISTYGRNTNLFAGSLVQIELNEFKYNPLGKDRDVEYTGLYVIESIEHSFDKFEYRTNMNLTMYGQGDAL